jgi:hypothetical protein
MGGGWEVMLMRLDEEKRLVRDGRLGVTAAEEELVRIVGVAREKGLTWEEIGAEWGVSKQAAFQWVQRRSKRDD